MRSAFMLPLLVILSGGWAISSCDDDNPAVPPAEGVYIVSSQRTYKQGDEITVRVINATSQAKRLYTCGGFWYGLYLRTDGSWENVSGFCTEFPPQSIHLAAFDKITLMAERNVQRPTGEYRLGGDICAAEGGSCELVFSEPFRLLGD